MTYILYGAILISETRKTQTTTNTEGRQNMTTIQIQAITEMGCVVYTSIKVSNDYTMNEVVKAVRNSRYKAFRLVDTMKRFVEI